MKIIVAILVASLFTLIALLKGYGFFEIGTIYFLGIEEMGIIDLGFLKDIVNKLLLIPESFNNLYSEKILSIIQQLSFSSKVHIGENNLILFLTFIFYFLLSLVISLITNAFKLERDKIYFIFLSITFYIIFLHII